MSSAVCCGDADGCMTWLSTTRTTMSMAASSCSATQLHVVRRDPVDHHRLGGREQRARVGGQQREQLGVRAMRGRDDGLEQQVVLGGLEHGARRVADRGDQVGRVRVEGHGDQAEEPLQLAQDHPLREQRLRADLVVDGLPAHADHVGEPRHRHLGPADLGGQGHGRVDDALAHRHRGHRRHGHERYGAQRAGSRSRGTKSTFSRTPQSGQHQLSGTSFHAVPAAKPSCSSPASTS